MADGPILSDNKLTILAGNGKVPIDVARAAQENGIEVFVICLGDEADPADFPSHQAERVAWGALGTLNKLLDKSGAQTLTLVGGIAKRPDLSAIRLDAGAVMALPKIVKLMAGGDESVLGKIARYFEGRGYRLLGAHEVAPSLLCREGLLGSVAVSPEAREDLVTACRGAGVAGQIDLGQAAISVNGRLVGLEGPEALTERIGVQA